MLKSRYKKEKKSILNYRKKSKANYAIWLGTVIRANNKVKEKARLILGGKCKSCGSTQVLELHHVNGDGNKEPDRSTTTISRFIISNPSQKRIILLCKECHLKADNELRKIGLLEVKSKRKFTDEEFIQLLKEDMTTTEMSKELKCSRATINNYKNRLGDSYGL